MTLDATDIRLLSALQENGQMTAEALGQTLNLSPSQAGRRRARLEAEGYIEGYRARVSPEKVGLGVQAFVQIQITGYRPDEIKSLLRIVETRPEITAAWTLTGQADYLLRVYCETLSALNRLIQETLLPHPAVARVESQIVMEHFKADAPLPL